MKSPQRKDSEGDRRRAGTDVRGMYRTLGVGIELAAVILGLTLVGYFIDKRFETEPWGAAIGSMLGIVVGCYNAIKEVNSQSKKRK